MPDAKFAPPRPPTAIVDRPRLARRLDAALSLRLTALVAGPGFGKTTLLADWTRGLAARSAWYALGREDAALENLVRGLAQALGISLGTAVGFGGGPEVVAAHVGGAVQEQLREDVALVVDDVHELPRRGPSMAFVAALVRHAPPQLHLILSSRKDLPFATERLRGRGEVLDLDARTLAFSQSEVEAMLEEAIGTRAPGLARELHELTGGWPAAVRLAMQTVGSAQPEERPAVVERLRRPGGALFAYLAEEVFAAEAPGVRELLRWTAPFDRFTADLCSSLGISNARQILLGLEKKGLFVAREDESGQWFRLHELVRDFVRDAWPIDAAVLRALHAQAAGWFDAAGHPEWALRSIVCAADNRQLAQYLRRRGPGLLASGRIESVIQALEALPERVRDTDLWQLAGHAYEVRGDWDRALAAFEAAGAGNARLGSGMAWRVGLIHYLRGQLDEALRVFERGELTAEGGREEALLLAWTATVHWVRGDLERSRSLAEQAVARGAGDDQALAAAYTVLAMLASVEGDQVAARRDSFRALEHAQAAGDMLQMIRIHANQGSHLADEGAYEEALSEHDHALRLAEVAGFANFQALALSNRGETQLHLGRLDSALADLDSARSLYERLGSSALCYPLGHLGDVYRQRGDLERAGAVYREAIEIAERSGDAQGLTPALAGLARVLAHSDSDQARRLVDRALADDGRFAHVEALLAAGWVHLARSDREAATLASRRAAAAAGERRDRAGLAEAIELSVMAASAPGLEAARLEEATAIWAELCNPVGETRCRLALARLSGDATERALADGAERRLRALGVRTRPPLAAGLLSFLPAERPAPVAIRTLGGFAVFRDGELVDPTEWQSKKARDLLKILVARRGRPLPREALMEALWPNEEPAKLPNRLSVALATVRAVLDPERCFGPGGLVEAGKDAVALDVSQIAIDVEDFLHDASKGLTLRREGRLGEAVTLLETADTIYRGEFLEEDAYEDWAIPLREEARASYIAVAGTLAELAERGDLDATTRYHLRVLEHDAYDEAAHLGLVRTLEEARHYGEARRAYRRYVARMEEIGAEPAPFPAP